MRKRIATVIGMSAAAALVLTACGSSDDTATETVTVTEEAVATGGTACVILPDSQSSDRWENQDRPSLQAAFEAAGFNANIQNAQGDTTQYVTIGDQMLAEGCGVMVLVDLNGAGQTVGDKAKAQGIPVIAYDRPFDADYYVSFDNVGVGKFQGEGLVKCLTDKGVDLATAQVVFLNGSPTDGNAAMFKEGYETALKAAGVTPVKDESVPDWDNQRGGVIFEQMFTDLGGKIDGVLAANDGLGGAAIAVLDKNGVTLPVTGQDATVGGLQNVLLGKQCMTVWKDTTKQAAAASALAIALLQGERPTTTASYTTADGVTVAAVYETPQIIYAANVKDVTASGQVNVAELCSGNVAAKCAEFDVQ